MGEGCFKTRISTSKSCRIDFTKIIEQMNLLFFKETYGKTRIQENLESLLIDELNLKFIKNEIDIMADQKCILTFGFMFQILNVRYSGKWHVNPLNNKYRTNLIL